MRSESAVTEQMETRLRASQDAVRQETQEEMDQLRAAVFDHDNRAIEHKRELATMAAAHDDVVSSLTKERDALLNRLKDTHVLASGLIAAENGVDGDEAVMVRQRDAAHDVVNDDTTLAWFAENKGTFSRADMIERLGSALRRVSQESHARAQAEMSLATVLEQIEQKAPVIERQVSEVRALRKTNTKLASALTEKAAALQDAFKKQARIDAARLEVQEELRVVQSERDAARVQVTALIHDRVRGAGVGVDGATDLAGEIRQALEREAKATAQVDAFKEKA